MDQLKTGKFIAQMRKERGLTQRQLADALLISDKTVSKWECGNGMPEVSLMMPLCQLLGITVNELLSGKRLTSFEYQQNAEENIMRLIKERQEAKFRMVIEVLVIFLTFLASISLIMVAGLTEISPRLRIALVVIGLVVMALGIGIAAALEMRRAVFQCKKCGERFVPTKLAYLMGMHTVTRRVLKCPKCGKTGWCKRCLSETEDEQEEKKEG